MQWQTSTRNTEYDILSFGPSRSDEVAQTWNSGLVQINLTGRFFNNAGGAQFRLPDGTTITFDNDQTAQAFVLLHELAHQTHVILSEGLEGVAAKQQEGFNNQFILDNCFDNREYHK